MSSALVLMPSSLVLADFAIGLDVAPSLVSALRPVIAPSLSPALVLRPSALVLIVPDFGIGLPDVAPSLSPTLLLRPVIAH